MNPQLMLVVDNGGSKFYESVEKAKRAGMRVIGVRNTQEALDVVWEQGDNVELIATELADPSDLEDLEILVSDWEHLNVLVFSDTIVNQQLVSERITFVNNASLDSPR